jgi:hypothetical protein
MQARYPPLQPPNFPPSHLFFRPLLGVPAQPRTWEDLDFPAGFLRIRSYPCLIISQSYAPANHRHSRFPLDDVAAPSKLFLQPFIRAPFTRV